MDVQGFFAESHRLCVPELKSVGWQCAIPGQLVGTTKIQDGCRDPGKLQNVFILHYIMLGTYFCMYTHAFRYEEFNGTVYNNVRLCSHDQNSKWPPFSPTIARFCLSQNGNSTILAFLNVQDVTSMPTDQDSVFYRTTSIASRGSLFNQTIANHTHSTKQ